ncbi:hypothetical protein [Achromobacter pestifer]
MPKRTALFTLCLAFFPVGGSADSESIQAASAGRATWAAFECAGYAHVAGQEDEARRLTQFGIEQGRRFFKAHRSGLISKADLEQLVPVDVSIYEGGPSDDFSLGQVHSSAAVSAANKVRRESKPSEPAMWMLVATEWYGNANCALIGR